MEQLRGKTPEEPKAIGMGEIEQDLLDVRAWSFILWCRVRALRRHAGWGLARKIVIAVEVPAIAAGGEPTHGWRRAPPPQGGEPIALATGRKPLASTDRRVGRHAWGPIRGRPG